MLDPTAIVEILVRHDVQFVVIGGAAAMVHDLPLPPPSENRSGRREP